MPSDFVLQTILFDKKYFTLDDVINWIVSRHYTLAWGIDTNPKNHFRVRQRNVTDFIKSTFKTFQLPNHIDLIFGHIK